MTVYKIERSDKQFSKGNSYGRASKLGKIWTSIGALRNHFHNFTNYAFRNHDNRKKMIVKYPDLSAVVVEYELVEKRRIPVKEFIQETMERYLESREETGTEIIINDK